MLARIPRLVYGATDPKAGACGSVFDIVQEPRLNHRVEPVTGILAPECGGILQDFFRARRKKRGSNGAGGEQDLPRESD